MIEQAFFLLGGSECQRSDFARILASKRRKLVQTLLATVIQSASRKMLRRKTGKPNGVEEIIYRLSVARKIPWMLLCCTRLENRPGASNSPSQSLVTPK
jgi:hypothetical protein